MENAPKFCPKCGNQLKPDAKFCPKCGFAIAEAASVTSQSEAPAQQPQTAVTQPSSATATEPDDTTLDDGITTNYFTWYLTTLKHPGRPIENVNRLFGVISLVAEALLMALTAFTLGKKMESVLAYTANEYDTKVLNMLNADGVVFKFALTTLIFCFLTYVIYASVSYGFRRMAAAEKINYWDFINRYAGVTNLVLVFNLLTLLMSFVPTTASFVDFSASTFFWIIFMVISFLPANLITNIAYVFIIVTDIRKTRLDKFYVVLLAVVVLGIVMTIFTTIMYVTAGVSTANYFQHLNSYNYN